MLPQHGPCYPAALGAGAAPVYGQPGFYTPPTQSLIVPVGIPAGVASVYGSVANGGNAVPGGTLAHMGNVVPGVAHVHMGHSHMGNLPAQSLPASNSFVQPQPSSFIQPSASNNVYGTSSNTDLPGQWQGHPRRSCSPPPSSFPPGFEPRHSNSIATGIPSQPASDNRGTGGLTMHVQHQHHFQQQHQQQNQLELQHQRHFHSQQQQHQPGQQPPHSHQHQYQHQQQHQHFQNQPPHPLQHQHQHQQHNLLQIQHQHHNQHPPQFQLQHNSQQQHQHQQPLAQQRHQYEHQQYLHTHSEAQRFTQIQPQNFHQSNFHPQLQPQMSQPQLHLQPHPTSQQAQPLMQVHQPNFQTCTANGVAIGLPVMPTHSNLDAMGAQSTLHSQQPTPVWQQPAHLENSLSSSQLLKSNVLDNGPLVVVSQGELYPNGQHSTNILRASEAHTKGDQSLSLSMPKSHPGPKGMRSADSTRVDNSQINGHLQSGAAHPSSSIESNHRNWPSSPRVQLQEGPSAGNPSRASRDYQSHSITQYKSQSNQPLPPYREKFSGNRGKPFSKGLGKRSDMQPLRCGPCDRTFTTSVVLADHLKSHVKCGEEGCFFEAAGKVVKEHKVVEHGKVEFQSTPRGCKALALRSMEDIEDIKRWREERKRSYPTSGTILQKAEEKRKREAEGDDFNEEAQQRRQRLMDIIAKQKQLGYQIPEIPSHYFRTQHNRQLKKSRLDDNSKPATVQEENLLEDGSNGKSMIKETGDTSTGMQNREALSHDNANDNDNQDYRNGHFKKGNHNKFSSWQDRKRARQNSHPTIALWQRPSLLSQLLSKDIEAENSQLLQCCRFIVNNAFLQDCALTSLKHFGWIAAASCVNIRDVSADVMDPKLLLKLGVGEKEESYQVTASKNPETVKKEVISKKPDESVTDKDVICCDIEDALDVSPRSPRKRKAIEEQNLKQPGRELHHSCLQKGSGIVMSNTDSNLQMHSKELPNAHVELDHGASDKIMGRVLTSWKPRSMSTEFLPRDLGTGEAASGNSESVVEDEEDISQYMNLDVSGVDSGCCYD